MLMLGARRNVDTMFLHKTLESPLSGRSCLALFGVGSLTEGTGHKYATVCIVKELFFALCFLCFLMLLPVGS